jgi:hypothetical protein
MKTLYVPLRLSDEAYTKARGVRRDLLLRLALPCKAPFQAALREHDEPIYGTHLP